MEDLNTRLSIMEMNYTFSGVADVAFELDAQPV